MSNLSRKLESYGTYHCEESISPDKANSVGKDCSASSIGNPDTRSRIHTCFDVLDEQPRVKLYHVWGVIQLPKYICNLRVRVDLLELGVLLQAKVSSELV